MAESLKCTEGVILHILPYRDYDRIITIFTPDLGIVKAFIPKALAPKSSQGATDPLTRGEFVLNPGKGDLMRCRDITILSQNIKLREKLTWLRAACDMVKAINSSQMANKSAPELYMLFIRYLEKLPLIGDPQTLVTSFYLKLLRHEGLLHIGNNCSQCDQPLASWHLCRGESYCKSHAPMGALPFSKSEIECANNLNFCRSFTEFATLTTPEELGKKIKELFNQVFT